MITLTIPGRIAVISDELKSLEVHKVWLKDYLCCQYRLLYHYPDYFFARRKEQADIEELKQIEEDIRRCEDLLINLGVEVKDLP